MQIEVLDAPALDLYAHAVRLPTSLEGLPTPPWLHERLRAGESAEERWPPGLREAVRDLLRGHGYKPTGRGKPSSEYLAAAAREGRLESINAVVDIGNAVSLHAGVPISVVDLATLVAPMCVKRPPAGTSYVFNRGGQTIDVGGLLCLCDAVGPCANAVKDSQRTKTSTATTEVLLLVWAPSGTWREHAEAASAEAMEFFARIGAREIGS
ncbi:MAG: phenylalanine--tRNA ligase beta subunit-related protein [Planctomycetota bacterium]